ncbi:MAG: hypothetical protein AAFV07_16930, partial [Bacteroidota bacterium]
LPNYGVLEHEEEGVNDWHSTPALIPIDSLKHYIREFGFDIPAVIQAHKSSQNVQQPLRRPISNMSEPGESLWKLRFKILLSYFRK